MVSHCGLESGSPVSANLTMFIPQLYLGIPAPFLTWIQEEERGATPVAQW